MSTGKTLQMQLQVAGRYRIIRYIRRRLMATDSLLLITVTADLVPEV
jgi:hypothetical protein